MLLLLCPAIGVDFLFCKHIATTEVLFQQSQDSTTIEFVPSNSHMNQCFCHTSFNKWKQSVHLFIQTPECKCPLPQCAPRNQRSCHGSFGEFHREALLPCYALEQARAAAQYGRSIVAAAGWEVEHEINLRNEKTTIWKLESLDQGASPCSDCHELHRS